MPKPHDQTQIVIYPRQKELELEESALLKQSAARALGLGVLSLLCTVFEDGALLYNPRGLVINSMCRFWSLIGGNYLAASIFVEPMVDLITIGSRRLPSFITIDKRYALHLQLKRDFVPKTSPLFRRVQKVVFTDLEKDLQRNIAKQFIADKCQELQIILTENQKVYLESLIKKNRKPGVGELLEDIKSYLGNLDAVEPFADKGDWAVPDTTLLFSRVEEPAPEATKAFTWLPQEKARIKRRNSI